MFFVAFTVGCSCKLYLLLCLRKMALGHAWYQMGAGWQAPPARTSLHRMTRPVPSPVHALTLGKLCWLSFLTQIYIFSLQAELRPAESIHTPLPPSLPLSYSSSEANARARLITCSYSLWKLKVHCRFQFPFQSHPESNLNRLVPLQNTFRMCLWSGRNGHFLSWVSRNIFSLSCVSKTALTVPISLDLL